MLKQFSFCADAIRQNPTMKTARNAEIEEVIKDLLRTASARKCGRGRLGLHCVIMTENSSRKWLYVFVESWQFGELILLFQMIKAYCIAVAACDDLVVVMAIALIVETIASLCTLNWKLIRTKSIFSTYAGVLMIIR